MRRENRCICGKVCEPVIFIGGNRIPICEDCWDKISDSDIEWDKDITSEELKKRIAES